MIRRTITKDMGITLIELLAVLALIVAIGAVTIPMVVHTILDFREGIEKSRLFKEAQNIEAQLIYVVRNTTNKPGEDSYLQVDGNRYSFYSSEDQTEKYAFELDGTNLIYTKDTLTLTLSEKVTAFTLREEGDTVKKLVYTIQLSGTANGKTIEIKLEDRYIYFPIWSY